MPAADRHAHAQVRLAFPSSIFLTALKVNTVKH